jgi:hypothetical protein
METNAAFQDLFGVELTKVAHMRPFETSDELPRLKKNGSAN